MIALLNKYFLFCVLQVFAQNLYAMKMSDSAGLSNGGSDKFR
jgi:hypothetical protein